MEIYTALIYEGPEVNRRIHAGLRELLRKDGYQSYFRSCRCRAQVSIKIGSSSERKYRSLEEGNASGLFPRLNIMYNRVKQGTL